MLARATCHGHCQERKTCVEKREQERLRWTSTGWETEVGGARNEWKRERREESVNASYCWNAGATRSTEGGGSVGVCGGQRVLVEALQV